MVLGDYIARTAAHRSCHLFARKRMQELRSWCSMEPVGRFRRHNFSSTRRIQEEQHHLSRTERRKMERKARNRAKRDSFNPTSSKRSDIPTSTSSSGWFYQRLSISPRFRNFLFSLTPRIPLRKERLDSAEHWRAVAYRLPFFLALCYAFTNKDIAPYVIQASLGPSMLPTIQFVGDIWLVETGAWRRAWRSLWKNEQNASVDISSYQVGDLVLWKDSRTGRISCKRIVGLEGDRVKTYGQFVELYSNRPDLGIVWPSDAAARGLSSKETFLEGIRQIKKIDSEHSIEQIMMVVPENHLWVEGDCPLFSVDSRHYGPIPTTTLEGRLVMRLWPWTRQEMVHEQQNSHFSSCWISRTRPVPYASEESYLGKKFDFYRVPKVGSETSLRPS